MNTRAIQWRIPPMLAALLATMPSALASTVNLSGCAQATVQAAVTAAKDGDVIMIPAGTCTWSTAVQWTDKSIWVIGAGIGATGILTQREFGVWRDR